MPTCPKCKAKFQIIAGEQPVCPGCGAKFKASKPAPPPESILPPLAVPAVAAAVVETPPIAPADTPPPFTVRVASKAPVVAASPYEAPVAVSAPAGPVAFTPRQYPAMRTIISVLYVFAILTVISFVLNLGFGLLVIFGGVAASRESGLAAGMGLLSGLAYIVVSLFSHALLVLIFMASAESIRVWLDILHNTQEAAFYSRLSRQWS